ncbi:LLM class flavin-dependent oxidoreductase [Minwuia thermotolerans]|uniref:LLM class flavin-dependent oxidoreductase n=1 Tax=Minwuia thermotolerans TaxID=2056226 RepID=UPI000F63D79F|nr:LLM class flavin-dependent oxidoreductase [Minwuia thermotolerans]
MPLPLEKGLKFGIQSMYRRTEPATSAWQPSVEDGRTFVELVDALGFDSLWVGDHLAFALPMLDPLIQLAQAATYSDRLTLGTAVYLLPLRHPGPVAKQVATLDLLSSGRFVFGVGVGGEFETDYAVAGVPRGERGARLTESIDVLRKLWRGERVSHQGRYFKFDDILMQPPPLQSGGPPIWCGGRSDAALHRAGRMAEGWMSYVVTSEMYRDGLRKIETAYEEAERHLAHFTTAHLVFARLDKDYETALNKATETLSIRYDMDFRAAAKRYCALGTADDIAAQLNGFYEAGVRHIVLDLVGDYEERIDHMRAFADTVLPRLRSLGSQ